MKQSWRAITIAAAILTVGCSSAPDLQTATLQCTAHERECFTFFSLTEGVLTAPPTNPELVDLVFYFDGDDCSQGAIIGNDDRPGYLFPVGHRSWSELVALKPPTKDVGSVAGISPLTKDKEGLAFWVKARGREYILVRIRAIQPASHADLISGGISTLELEWLRPETREGE